MKWIKNLYVEDSLAHPEEVVYLLRRHIPVFGLYLIAVERKERPRIVLWESRQALRKNSRKLTVAGFAYGKENAMALLAQIVADLAGKNGLQEPLASQLLRE